MLYLKSWNLVFVDNFQLLAKLDICFMEIIDQYHTRNVKIKFFDLSIIIHTPVTFKDCSQFLTFCLPSSKLNFSYAILGTLTLCCIVNNPLYYGHESLGSAFSGCLPLGDLSHITNIKIVDADRYLIFFFSPR